MAEQFLEDIYKYSRVASVLKECSMCAKRKLIWKFGKLWTSIANDMLDIANEWMQYDYDSAITFTKMLTRVKEAEGDMCICGYIIEKGLLPTLYQFLDKYATISVEDGNYLLESSRTGFLTIRDLKNNRYLHSLDDPMNEANELAKILFTPKVQSMIIMGAGLGYLAYAIWELSYKAVDIYILESNPEMVDYAYNYGVLSWINPDNLHIIIEEDANHLLDYIGEEVKNSNKGSIQVYISDWMQYEFDGDIKKDVWFYIENQKSISEFEDRYAVNYWKNKGAAPNYYVELKDKYSYDEWIVVAAGPSLNDNIEFLKANVGKKGIIAVNTSLRRMLKEGIKPDLVVLLDPTEGVYKHIENILDETSDIPLLVESCAYWRFVEDYKGPKYRMFGVCIDETKKEVKDNDLSFRDVGTTVSSMGLEEAIILGAKKIYCVGMDLAFPGNKNYADGMVQGDNHIEGSIMVRSVDGGMVSTGEVFNKFRFDIESKIEKNKKVTFINLSKHGARIKGALTGDWWEYISNSDYFESAKKLENEECLDWDEKYYLIWQLMFYLYESYKNGDIGVEYLNQVKNIIDNIVEKIKIVFSQNVPPITEDGMQEDDYIYLLTSYLPCNGDEYSEKILSDAYQIITEANKKVMIVNTQEYMGGKTVAMYNSVQPEKGLLTNDSEYVFYRGIKIPYYQFIEGMPRIDFASEFLQFMINHSPERVIVYDKYSLFADVCGKYVKVVMR